MIQKPVFKGLSESEALDFAIQAAGFVRLNEFGYYFTYYGPVAVIIPDNIHSFDQAVRWVGGKLFEPLIEVEIREWGYHMSQYLMAALLEWQDQNLKSGVKNDVSTLLTR